MTAQRLRVRGGVLRIAAWHGHADVAAITVRGRTGLDAHAVDALLARLRDRGYREVITGALGPAASLPFVDAGFAVRSRLRVLVRDLGRAPAATGHTRRARRRDRAAILAADADAFDAFWRLHAAELREAVRATPSAHVRVAPAAGDEVAGYGVFGRAGVDGYVQRLAVRAADQGAGLGRALLHDGLAWLQRRGARRAFVNTQVENGRATEIYERAGFAPLPVGLCVLGRHL